MSDTGGNFISEKLKNFCNSLNVKQSVSSSYHHQSNGQLEGYIKFIKHTTEICSDSSGDIHMVLLQIRTTPLGQGLQIPATLLFNCLVCGMMPVVDRKPFNIYNDDDHHKNVMHRWGKNDQNNDTSIIFMSFPIGSTVAVQHEDGGLWTQGTIIGKGNNNLHNRSYKINNHQHRKNNYTQDNTSSQHI